MSNERTNEEMDELVSKTYRELANENTPEQLDQAILQMASRKTNRSGAGNSLFAPWMKPVAWAATIGLSLAIVLEFTELQSPEPGVVQHDAQPAAVSEDEPVVEIDLSDVASKRKLDSYATSAPGIGRTNDREQDASEPAALEEARRESDASNACDTQTRESVESWLACITELRASGAIDAADLEYEALIREYPEETAEFETNK